MRVAVIGSGISGLLTAYLLAPEQEVTLIEKEGRLGGHTNTVDIKVGGHTYAIDTGFIVCNNRTYPNFLRLLARLGVATQPSSMSFSVRCEKTGLEYSGGSFTGLFAQWRNLFVWSFHRMLREILRFNREAALLLRGPGQEMPLGDYLAAGRYSREFIDHYLIPMGSAIWSLQPAHLGAFPARYFLRFFQNHGLLNVFDRPGWLTIVGGAKSYIPKLTPTFQQRIRLNYSLRSIRRHDQGVELTGDDGSSETFDQVVLAVHADQALALLADPSANEREVLGAFAYQANEAVLHTDITLLPRCRRAWASWNYHLPRDSQPRSTVTYNLTMLQNLSSPDPFLVTLNRTESIDPSKVLRRFHYHHPIYSPAALAAQKRWAEISGQRRTHYCGAYWGHGFHEDGVNSALAVGRQWGRAL